MSLPIYQRVAVTDAGDIIPGAEYTVINENTGVAAPIYSDRTGATLLTAPYFADSVGIIQFFIAQGTTFRVAGPCVCVGPVLVLMALRLATARGAIVCTRPRLSRTSSSGLVDIAGRLLWPE